MGDVALFDTLPVGATMRDRVLALQHEVAKHEQFEPPTEHIFHGGMYCRQVFQPAGVLVIGKVHKKDHFFFIASGTAAVTTDFGVQELTGPCLLSSKVGTKRAIYAETDLLYMTIHATETLTVEAAEEEMVEPDPTSLFGVGNKLKRQQIEEV